VTAVAAPRPAAPVSPAAPSPAMTRRDLLRRSAVLGGGLAVAAPAIQSFSRPAFAASAEGEGLDIALVVVMQRRPAPRAPWQDLSDQRYRLRFDGGICVTPALDFACDFPGWEWSGLPGHASSALPIDGRFPGVRPTISVSHTGGVLRVDLSPATFQSDIRRWDYRFVTYSMAIDNRATCLGPYVWAGGTTSWVVAVASPSAASPMSLSSSAVGRSLTLDAAYAEEQREQRAGESEPVDDAAQPESTDEVPEGDDRARPEAGPLSPGEPGAAERDPSGSDPEAAVGAEASSAAPDAAHAEAPPAQP